MKVDSVLTVKISELTPQEWDRLLTSLTYATPQGEIVLSYRRYLTKGYYKMPRGAWFAMPDSIVYQDERAFPDAPELNFTLKLDNTEKDIRFAGQSEAVEAAFREEQGLIIRPPGTGKSAIATAFAARVKTPTLILVHTEDILQQWVGYIEDYIPELKGKVGVIRGKTCKVGQITVATVQTLNRQEKPKSWWAQWGAVVIDEAHHASAPTWEGILNQLPARYRIGFTASPTRADGMHPSMRFIIGPVIHRQKFTSSVKLEVVPVKTKFRFAYRGPFDWSRLLDALISNNERNSEIAKVVNREYAEGNSILILSRRIEHLELIAEHVSEDANAEILTGKRSKSDRTRILKDFKSGKCRVLFATQLADEALDVPRLNRVVLVYPGKHEGRIIQQIGRALRQFQTKKDAVIYDFTDQKVGVLRRQWSQRKRTYKVNDISVRSSGTLNWRRNGN